MKKRHQVLLVLSLLSMVTFLDRIAISTAGNRITKELGLSSIQWGWILGTFTLAYALFEIPTGLLGDRLGAKKVLIRVVLWWSFFTILTGFSTGFVMMLLVRFFFGMGEAGAYPNMSIILSKWFPANERGRGQSFIWASSRIGAALTPFFVIPIQQQFGWQMSFYILGFLGVVWVLFFAFWHTEEPSEASNISAEEVNEIMSNRQLEKHHSTSNKTLSQVFSSANVWFLLGMYYCYATGTYFFQSWLPKYLQQGRGVSEDELKWLAALPFVFATFGCLFGGIWSDKAIKKYGQKWGRRLIPIIGLSLASISLFVVPFVQNTYLATFILALGMACMDVTAPVAWAVAMDIGRERSGLLSGAMNTAGLTGAYISTVSFGYLVSTFGYEMPLFLLGGIVFIGALIWFKIDASEPIV